MKKQCSVLLFCLFLATNVMAQVTFSPEKPQAGQTVTITYNSVGTPLSKSNIVKADAYYFDVNTATMTQPVPIVLQKEGTNWKGVFEVKPEKMVGILVAFRDSSGAILDNNKDNGYHAFVYDENGKTLKGAKIGLASVRSAGRINRNFQLSPQALETVNLYEEDFASSPELKVKYGMTYLLALASSKRDGYKEIVNKETDELLESAKSEPEMLQKSRMQVAVGLYKQIGEKEKAEKLATKIRETDPKGNFVQMEKLEALSEEKDDAKKIAMFKAFEADFPNSMFTSSMLQMTLKSYIEVKDVAGLKEMLSKYESKFGSMKASMYNNAARNLAEKDLELATAEEFSKKSLDGLTNKSAIKNYKDTYGYILEKQGKNEEAYQAFKEALDGQPDKSSEEINERFILAAIKTGHTDEAMSVGEQALKAGKATEKTTAALKELFVKAKGKKEGEAFVANLEKESLAKKKETLLKKMMNEPAPDFTLKDLKGNTVSLSGLRGKVVVVDFWATWCGPCINSFPGMQKAQQKYANNPNVKFLFVDTWEKVDDYVAKVNEFLEKKKYTDFTVPLDAEGKVVSSYKVTGIPTKFIIDGKGNIRFKAVGSNGNAAAIVEEVSTMIDAALDTAK